MHALQLRCTSYAVRESWNPMRALYHHRTQGRGVEAVHILGVCGGLRELGCEVEIASPPGVEVTTESHSAGKSRWGWVARSLPQLCFELLEVSYNLAAVPRLVKRIRKYRPDFIYERYALYNAAGLLAGRLTRTPLILEINETVDVDRERQGKQLVMRPLARWFERSIFRAAAGIAAVSGYLRDQAVAIGVEPERIHVTPNAVDPEWFDPERFAGDVVRARWRMQGCQVIGFVGSFARWHRIDLLVAAFAKVTDQFPDARLLLVGDGAFRSSTVAQVEELGLRARVAFTGRIGHDEIPEHVAAMDIGVMPASNPFGSPMKVFEYMSMGVPTVAPRLGPLEEALRDGRDGLLFTPDDADALAEALRTLMADDEARRRMGTCARARVLRQHRWVHNAQAAIDLAPVRGRTVEAAPAEGPQCAARTLSPPAS
jgi:glycosyltransferase involved in cell wall biosynthesis